MKIRSMWITVYMQRKKRQEIEQEEGRQNSEAFIHLQEYIKYVLNECFEPFGAFQYIFAANEFVRGDQFHHR